jgi:signal transduction histidine kinase
MTAPLSLRTRLVISHLVVALLSIILISGFAGRSIFEGARADAEYNLQNLAFSAANVVEYPLEQFQNGEVDAAYVQSQIEQMFGDSKDMQYTIYQVDGVPLLDRSGTLPAKADRQDAPEVWMVMQNDVDAGFNLRQDSQGEQVLYLAVPILRGNQVIGIMRLAAPLDPTFDAARRSFGLLLLAALLIASALSLFGWLLANNLAKPILELTQAAEQLAHSDQNVHVTPKGAQEIRRLAQAFNIMAVRLQDHMEQLRTFVSNASHELRTPLTVVKLRVEALRNGALEDPDITKQFLGDVETEVDRLVCMVNDMLDLSRLEAGLASSQRTPLNLGVLATEVYETFSIRAARSGVELRLDIQPGLPPVPGNEDQIRRVFYNLVENAIKYTTRGGQVDLLLRLGVDGKSVRLLVKDTGSGISQDNLAHIFERFYRAESTRPRPGMPRGSGLGLAIAKSIVENHGGRIGVSSQVGKGSTFWVDLPSQS